MIIRLNNVSKDFRNHEAIRDLNLEVPEGSAFALIGANGAGKTTTIKIIMNMLAPTRGNATIMGVDSQKLSPHEFALIGYVSENQNMPARLTVRQYLNYLRPFYPAWDRQLEHSLLDQLGLPPDRRIGELSHGMRMKMSLACALPFRPKLLVLDEPFSGLDPLVRDELMGSLIGQAGEATVLISSHELSEIESVVTHIGFMDKGRLLFQESMEELTGRLREVRVTLERAAPTSTNFPQEWLQVSTAGNVLSFVDTRFSGERLNHNIATLFGSVRNIEVEPVPLRSIYTALARAAQQGRTQK